MTRQRRRDPLGAVYTRDWVVQLLLDLVDYSPNRDLGVLRILEPCCGDGAFAVPIVERLLESSERFGREPSELRDCIRFVDINPRAVESTSKSLRSAMDRLGVDPATVGGLIDAWMIEGDFLLLRDEQLATFDVVVGNPPYIRVENMSAETRTRYRARWNTMRGRADVYVGFWQAALSFLAPGGHVGFITPDRWTKNGYGAGLREFMATKFDIALLLDLHDVAAFVRDVDAYPIIAVVSAGSSDEDVTVGKLHPPVGVENVKELVDVLTAGQPFPSSRIDRWTVRRELLSRDGWSLGAPETMRYPHSLIQALPTVGETGVAVHGGLATGADDVFISPAGDIEPELLRPIVGPSDFVDGQLQWAGRHLLYPWTDDRKLIDLSDYPRAATYLSNHRSRLERRAVVRGREREWWRTIDKELVNGYESPALLVPDIRDAVEPVLDREGYLPMHSLCRLTSPDWDIEVLGAILLSDLVDQQMRMMSVAMSSGRMRVSAQYLRRLRIPRAQQFGNRNSALQQAFRSRDRQAASEIVAGVLFEAER